MRWTRLWMLGALLLFGVGAVQAPAETLIPWGSSGWSVGERGGNEGKANSEPEEPSDLNFDGTVGTSGAGLPARRGGLIALPASTLAQVLGTGVLRWVAR